MTTTGHQREGRGLYRSHCKWPTTRTNFPNLNLDVLNGWRMNWPCAVHEEITAIDILDALASIGLKLMPDGDGISSHEDMGAHKSVIRSAKADQN